MIHIIIWTDPSSCQKGINVLHQHISIKEGYNHPINKKLGLKLDYVVCKTYQIYSTKSHNKRARQRFAITSKKIRIYQPPERGSYFATSPSLHCGLLLYNEQQLHAKILPFLDYLEEVNKGAKRD